MIARSNSLMTRIAIKYSPAVFVSIMGARVGRDCTTFVNIKILWDNFRPANFFRVRRELAAFNYKRKSKVTQWDSKTD